MYLKEIVIDGFKSYATRTHVKDFDPAFNAITGLNGSGKSNVLDSICFVLGITNLSQVRAQSLQELVYKGGLANTSKATVSLIFDNSDKSTAPVGYEMMDQITVSRTIVIGGRNKYTINGTTTQPNRVQNLFHSVGLNVNNPHFLIMQGRITKVINMKPPEVLSMIEEAAGTKMYENKKEAALRTIAKKERKVEEINSLLEDKINPSLAKLERERKHYIEWNQNSSEIEVLKRFTTAYRYSAAVDVLRRSSGQGSELHDRADEIKDSLIELKGFHEDAKKNLEDHTKSYSKEVDGGKVEQREEEVGKLGKKIVKMRSLWTNEKEALESERSAMVKVEETVASHQQKLELLEKELAQAEAEIKPAEEGLKQATDDLDTAETALLTGASTKGSQSSGAGSLIDQLESARRLVSQAQGEIESLNLEKKHIHADMQVKAGQLARDRENVRVLESQKKSAVKAIDDAKMALHELDFDSNNADELLSKLNDERRTIADLSEKAEQLSARLGGCHFQYTEPYPNFDHRKVHGLIAKLIEIKDSRMTTAVEVTAGGRLFQVVVDTDSTANDLLKRGKLVRRVTILPLNKIKHEVLSHSKLQRAKSLERSTQLALNLVGYDEEVSNAVEHIFGRTLICPDMNAAKRVTFDSQVRAKTVTWEGDTYDPSGTASGGSSSRQGPSILSLLGKLKDVETELQVHKDNANKLQVQVDACSEKARRFRQLQAALQVREDEAKLLDKRLEETSTGRLIKEVDALNKRFREEIPRALETAQKTLSEESDKAKKLEESMHNSESAKKRAEEEAEAAIGRVRQAHAEASKVLQCCRDRHSSLLVEVETVEEEMKRLQQELEEKLKPAVEKLRGEVELHENQLAELSDLYKKSEDNLRAEKDKLAASSEVIRRLTRECEDFSEKVEELMLEKARLDSKLRDAEKGKAGAEKLVADLDKKHPWIAQEKQLFGKEGTDYEFTEDRISSSRGKLESLEQRQEGLAKRINKKAMHMFETAKEEYRNLMNKKGIIEQDKEKIEKVIAGLDEKKMVAVENTWRKVNADFGNIFSDLLPGTSAKLEPPEGKSVQDGLEIRVAFGEVWKDSLSELSGGQRSLIALSLILAMLRFKPAPMYILDEVDAALDLSHTQNIGRMLRRHFSGSQFIVVSLKEGMFSNANVIFRTKFISGVSTIQRTENEAARLGKGSPSGPGEPSSDKENVENSPAVLAETSRRKRRAPLY